MLQGVQPVAPQVMVVKGIALFEEVRLPTKHCGYLTHDSQIVLLQPCFALLTKRRHTGECSQFSSIVYNSNDFDVSSELWFIDHSTPLCDGVSFDRGNSHLFLLSDGLYHLTCCSCRVQVCPWLAGQCGSACSFLARGLQVVTGTKIVDVTVGTGQGLCKINCSRWSPQHPPAGRLVWRRRGMGPRQD